MPNSFIRNPKVEMAPMKDETVLFNPANNKFCVLNATAAFIWQNLDRPNTVHGLAAEVATRFANVHLEQAEKDVRKALGDLQDIECVVES